jgi:hypothetical protein
LAQRIFAGHLLPCPKPLDPIKGLENLKLNQ